MHCDIILIHFYPLPVLGRDRPAEAVIPDHSQVVPPRHGGPPAQPYLLIGRRVSTAPNIVVLWKRLAVAGGAAHQGKEQGKSIYRVSHPIIHRGFSA